VHQPRFDAAFGKFILEFGRTETVLGLILEQFVAGLVGRSELTLDVVRALIGQRRSSDFGSITKLCLQAAIRSGSKHTQADLEEVGRLFEHLGQIAFLRNNTAHYGVGPRMIDGELYYQAHNRWAVRDVDHAQIIFFKIEHLEAATRDLRAISDRLQFALHILTQRQPKHSDMDDPWHFKPGDMIKKPFLED
jgi:hypothetical protein